MPSQEVSSIKFSRELLIQQLVIPTFLVIAIAAHENMNINVQLLT